MRISLIATLLLISTLLFAQKEVKTFYDPMKRQLQEHYFVADDNQTMDGKYKRYFPNGKINIEGT
ncbi:MAG: hypothetical protein ACOVNZ_10530, partial [Crocinitomicaceae bacterium]